MVALSVCASSLAEGDTFTLPELRAQAPERLQMTVSTATGTVTVDAPVILPKAEALPVLLCRSQRFRFEDDDQYHVLYAEKASEKHLIYGRTDATGRYVLPMGETPPENDFTLEEALDLILRLNAEAGGDSGVDLRLNRVAAMSGLCKMKSVKTTDESTGVSVRAMAADPAQPVKGKEKGIWLIELAQYLRGVRVIDDSGHRYRADGYFSPWVTKNESRVMDENNYHVLVGYLREVGTLADDSPLAGWDAVENSIRTLIAQGEMDRAVEFLGHPHVLTNRVTHGKKIGSSSLGFPTVNLQIPSPVIVPAFGVYVTKISVAGKQYPAVTNVGVRPTVQDNDGRVTVEGFILNFHGDLYGQELRVEFYHRLREERKFSSYQALSDEIRRNAQQTQDYFHQFPSAFA